MAERVDLDELERVAASERATVVLDLIAELRAARKVVYAATALNYSVGWHTEDEITESRARDLDAALAAYEQAGSAPS